MRYRYQVGDQLYSIDLERQGESYRALIDGESYALQVLGEQDGEITLLIEGKPLTVYYATHQGSRWLSIGGCTYVLEKPSPGGKRRGSGDAAEGAVRAPMPAQVRAVHIAEGETVQKGDTLLILEAMKMEIRIQAPRPGKIARLRVEAGQTVTRDELMLEIGEAETSHDG
jgi:acetyl/propionyl-CoA carboxylase alpha subunit